MKTFSILAASAGLTLMALASVAQEEDEGPIAYTYASYFYCDNGPLSRVDDIVAADADRVNGLVEDGAISGWGWLTHHTGGQWNRLFYHQHETLEGLLAGQAAIQDGAEDDDDGPSFTEVCPRHDDYIWQVEAGTAGVERGPAGFSVYYVCDIVREQDATEIVKEHFAPILNGFVEEGKLASWGWSTHVVGGQYRALQTMTASDMNTLLSARNDAISAIYEEGEEAGTEFSDICGPHVDYMWNIEHEANM